MAKSGKKTDGGGAGGLDRDFGYLMPFFDKVAEQAASLTGPARDEALRLIAGEKEKWTRLRALLSGAAGAPSTPSPRQGTRPAPQIRTGTARDLTGQPSPSPRAAPERARNAFTVGPLNRR